MLYALSFTFIWSYILSGGFFVMSWRSVSEIYFYILFSLIFIPALVYEICFAIFSRNMTYSNKKRLALTVGVPCLIISFLLMAWFTG